ncbi:phospholipase A2 inhibitor and Ly6/PLAUR domain-containing protein isoform X2 [Dicentrarchus labrax]|uniref:phospholipase A2 inhibitor and Ly6/PLAUR domain-containing protein isoform X2 n=1 Tax=Dicentrarchus labrax TaxID=13489 RepID=UPI0021F65AC3|nr:phospholipase A2 inhibitor and Ly6/PLAUR domain-containing protein isoform X2 [Dicentrarchus labrax]XP_051231753.1 phospholipase A2 inhibitor and Ly6/PLAUR domain-containing protein isoform X2 [Dicentrarchus labrax]
MKLILSLALIWMLSSTAEALQCLHKDTSVLQSCRSADEMCATIAYQSQYGNATPTTEKNIDRSCVPSFLCAGNNPIFSFSDSDKRLAASFHCCNTDGCNNQHLPYPDIQVKNGLECVSCVNSSCNETVNVQCVGAQDRCIKAVRQDDDTLIFIGCASVDVCEVFSQQDVHAASFFFGIPVSNSSSKCCGSSFCNSA